MSCDDYEGVMLVLCTPLQVKCYQKFFWICFIKSRWYKTNMFCI